MYQLMFVLVLKYKKKKSLNTKRNSCCLLPFRRVSRRRRRPMRSSSSSLKIIHFMIEFRLRTVSLLVIHVFKSISIIWNCSFS